MQRKRETKFSQRRRRRRKSVRRCSGRPNPGVNDTATTITPSDRPFISAPYCPLAVLAVRVCMCALYARGRRSAMAAALTAEAAAENLSVPVYSVPPTTHVVLCVCIYRAAPWWYTRILPLGFPRVCDGSRVIISWGSAHAAHIYTFLASLWVLLCSFFQLRVFFPLRARWSAFFIRARAHTRGFKIAVGYPRGREVFYGWLAGIATRWCFFAREGEREIFQGAV